MQSHIALVVDDHQAVRQALCERIKVSFSHCQLREAGSVGEALKIVEKEKEAKDHLRRGGNGESH